MCHFLAIEHRYCFFIIRIKKEKHYLQLLFFSFFVFFLSFIFSSIFFYLFFFFSLFYGFLFKKVGHLIYIISLLSDQKG